MREPFLQRRMGGGEIAQYVRKLLLTKEIWNPAPRSTPYSSSFRDFDAFIWSLEVLYVFSHILTHIHMHRFFFQIIYF